VRINTFRGVNYKSFAATEEIRLEPGFNVIVGRNNVGKTALAEVLSLRFSDNPHRSSKAVPRPGAQPDPTSRVELSIEWKGDELTDMLVREMPTFYVHTDPERPGVGETALRTALSDGVRVDAVVHRGNLQSASLSTDEWPTPVDYYLRFTTDASGNLAHTGPISGRSSDAPLLDEILASKFIQGLYYMSAVRFDIDENPIGTDPNLAPNASNLVQVLDLLSRNPSRWQRYFKQVRTVLPEIEAITFMPSGQGTGRVRALIWNIDPNTERGSGCATLRERYGR
jgi:hypothetical protein